LATPRHRGLATPRHRGLATPRPPRIDHTEATED
jgi:hypothetical protein